MRISSILISAAFLCATAVGVGVASQIYVDNSGVKQADAAINSDGTYTFDIRFGSNVADLAVANLDTGKKKLYFYCWDADGKYEVGWPGTPCEVYSLDNDVYKITVEEMPSNMAHFIVNNGKDQTGNLSADSVKHRFNNKQTLYVGISGLDGSTSFSYWGVDRNLTSLTPDTYRVWLKRSKYCLDGFVHSYHYWGEGIDEAIAPTGYAQYTTSGDNNHLVYFDVPTSAIGKEFQFRCYNATTGAVDHYTSISTTENTSYLSGDNAYLFYESDDSVAHQNHLLTKGILDDNANFNTATMAPLILGAYFTCETNADNGFGAAQQVWNTWFEKEGKVVLKNGDASIDDYGWTESEDGIMPDYKSGRVKAGVDCYTKIQSMIANQSSNSPSAPTFDIASNPYLFGAAITSSMVLLGGISVLAIRRKRRARS